MGKRLYDGCAQRAAERTIRSTQRSRRKLAHMSTQLRSPLFRAASQYHAALARYARAMKLRADLETPAQQVIAAGLRYRLALEAMRAQPGLAPRERIMTAARIENVRRTLASASTLYNLPPARSALRMPRWRDSTSSPSPRPRGA
jgi:hypothetical protein